MKSCLGAERARWYIHFIDNACAVILALFTYKMITQRESLKQQDILLIFLSQAASLVWLTDPQKTEEEMVQIWWLTPGNTAVHAQLRSAAVQTECAAQPLRLSLHTADSQQGAACLRGTTGNSSKSFFWDLSSWCIVFGYCLLYNILMLSVALLIYILLVFNSVLLCWYTANICATFQKHSHMVM